MESFVLDGDEETAGVDQILCTENPPNILNNSALIGTNSKFLLSGAHGGAASAEYCVADCAGSGNQAQSVHHHHHQQPQFDPDTQARLVALLEAAG